MLTIETLWIMPYYVAAAASSSPFLWRWQQWQTQCVAWRKDHSSPFIWLHLHNGADESTPLSTPLRLKKNNNGKDWNKFLTPSFSSASPPSDLQHGQREKLKQQRQKLQCDIVSGNPSGQFVLLSIIGLTSRYSIAAVPASLFLLPIPNSHVSLRPTPIIPSSWRKSE